MSTQDIGDIFREEEERLLAETRAAILAETAAWDALSQPERDAILAKREAQFLSFDIADEADEEEGEEDDDDA